MAEADLLVASSREEMTPSVEAAVKMLASARLSIPYFVRLCSIHKVSRTALRLLTPLEAGHGSVTGNWLELLEGLQRQTGAEKRYSRRVQNVFESVADILASTRVSFAPIRGQRLALRYHRHPPDRVSHDVDVLIHEDDVDGAMRAMEEAGFGRKYTGIQSTSRMVYKGQCVLLHRQLEILVDVNWQLTGNSGIGKIQEDMDAVWGRARHVRGHEWELSAEDTLFGLVRHVGHGHGFEHGMLQCCMDVAAIVRKEGGRLDWDLIGKLARDSECMRVLRFFAHFFDEYYRDETMPSLRDKLPRQGPLIGPREGRRFAQFVIAPLLCRGPIRGPIAKYANGLICHTGKLWALDKIGRLARILRELVWPGIHPLVIMTPYSKSQRIAVRRIQYYFVPFVPILPAIVLGTIVRLLAARSAAASR